MLLPQEPPLRVADGFAVVLPRGGGGSPAAAAPPARGPAPQAGAGRLDGAPGPSAGAEAPDGRSEASSPPAARLPPVAQARPRAAARALEPDRRLREDDGGRAGGRARRGAAPPPRPRAWSSARPGPGVPDGTDTGGDWYLAGVQQKIWMLWNQQIKAGFTQPVGVTFTILPDGNVTGVRVTQPSGASLLDMAAQRAILNAAPFGPLPREYGQNPRTIQALFKPSQ